MTKRQGRESKPGQGRDPGPAERESQASDSGQESVAVACPFCGSARVELFSLFGSQLLTSEYYCRNCATVFEQLKR